MINQKELFIIEKIPIHVVGYLLRCTDNHTGRKSYHGAKNLWIDNKDFGTIYKTLDEVKDIKDRYGVHTDFCTYDILEVYKR